MGVRSARGSNQAGYKTKKPLWFKEAPFLAVKMNRRERGVEGSPAVLIVMRAQATEQEIAQVYARIQSLGFRAHVIPGAERTAVGITGNHGPVAAAEFESLAGVAEAIPLLKPYKLVSREVKRDNTVVDVAGVLVGGSELVICAGPCSVESREQILEAARTVRASGARLLRGGAYKPRTSPYAFQGLGEEGLRYLAEAREETGLGIVTEAVDVETFDLVEEYADCLQIGARNMQNFALLRRAGRARKPVLLKRGMASTLEEFLLAAEYILSEGNYQVILCERGIRTFADHTRNTLDLSVVPAVQRLSHLPIIVDPSHGTGKRNKVHPMALAAVAVGASGLIVEVHPNPDRALTDGYQSLFPDQFQMLADDARAIATLLKNRKVAASYIGASGGSTIRKKIRRPSAVDGSPQGEICVVSETAS